MKLDKLKIALRILLMAGLFSSFLAVAHSLVDTRRIGATDFLQQKDLQDYREQLQKFKKSFRQTAEFARFGRRLLSLIPYGSQIGVPLLAERLLSGKQREYRDLILFPLPMEEVKSFFENDLIEHNLRLQKIDSDIIESLRSKRREMVNQITEVKRIGSLPILTLDDPHLSHWALVPFQLDFAVENQSPILLRRFFGRGSGFPFSLRVRLTELLFSQLLDQMQKLPKRPFHPRQQELQLFRYVFQGALFSEIGDASQELLTIDLQDSPRSLWENLQGRFPPSLVGLKNFTLRRPWTLVFPTYLHHHPFFLDIFLQVLQRLPQWGTDSLFGDLPWSESFVESVYQQLDEENRRRWVREEAHSQQGSWIEAPMIGESLGQHLNADIQTRHLSIEEVHREILQLYGHTQHFDYENLPSSITKPYHPLMQSIQKFAHSFGLGQPVTALLTLTIAKALKVAAIAYPEEIAFSLMEEKHRGFFAFRFSPIFERVWNETLKKVDFNFIDLFPTLKKSDLVATIDKFKTFIAAMGIRLEQHSHQDALPVSNLPQDFLSFDRLFFSQHSWHRQQQKRIAQSLEDLGAILGKNISFLSEHSKLPASVLPPRSLGISEHKVLQIFAVPLDQTEDKERLIGRAKADYRLANQNPQPIQKLVDGIYEAQKQLHTGIEREETFEDDFESLIIPPLQAGDGTPYILIPTIIELKLSRHLNQFSLTSVFYYEKNSFAYRQAQDFIDTQLIYRLGLLIKDYLKHDGELDDAILSVHHGHGFPEGSLIKESPVFSMRITAASG